MPNAWDERLRLIRFRRKRERFVFRDEFRIVPKWLIWMCAALTLLSLIVGLAINIHNFQTGDPIFPDDSYRGREAEANLWLVVVLLIGNATIAALVWTLGYVYRDAQRRGMNGALWTLLVLILAPMYLFIGLIIYLLIREPLPYTCPQCSTTVSARFNFCPNCKYNLHPACQQCQQEVSDADKFCPYCATQLKPAASPEAPVSSTPA